MRNRKPIALVAAVFGLAVVAAPVLAQPPAGAGGGNPHPSGATGNPHPAGGTGNPHQGSAPQGVGGGSGSNPSGLQGSGGNSGNGGNPGARGNGPPDHAGGGGAGGNPDRPSGKTTICHATHSETNPYVVITPSNNSLDAHGAHQDGEDIIPAPNGNCVTPTQEPPKEEPPNGNGNGPPTDGRGVSPDGAEVLTVAAAGAGDGGAPAAGQAQARERGEDDQLPFTGLGIGAMLITAAVLFAAGWIVRFRGFLTIGA
jgi:hypothetical protein